ncbi:hypothetical protein [Vreelandella olivaria]|uniref:hypothetical protein n=1 Tax=Vreelandella olivaria TaxID=390919 RepID=UPI00201ECDF2|nr:hypothetical protein [Halomonas olivaria]
MYDLFLFDTLPQQQANMASYNVDGQKVWLKKAAKRNSRLAYLPLSLLARLLRIEALKPVPNLGGEQSVIQEAARIKSLSQAGIAVPTILAESPQALLLADAGSEGEPSQTLLDKLITTQNADEIDHYLVLSTQALNDVHARECYLSEAFARNILVNKEGVVFIDFETDPGEYHPLTDCKVRDWHCFIFSLYGKLSKRQLHRERLMPALIDGLSQAQPEVRENFLATLPRLLRLKRFPFRRLGSDGKKIAITLHALSVLDQQLRSK